MQFLGIYCRDQLVTSDIHGMLLWHQWIVKSVDWALRNLEWFLIYRG